MSALRAQPTPRHNVFVSYHHANDVAYKTHFVNYFANQTKDIISSSVEIGDIYSNLPAETIRANIRDEFIRGATVTVVLIGTETWKRKHVDWEIASSLRQTKLNPRCGLVGLILPTHPDYQKQSYTEGIVPSRLVDNQKSGFAKIYNWTTNGQKVVQWIHEAYERRLTVGPDNSREGFRYNRTSNSWC
ncbi:MAG: TIR domain-containing protein [Planctomycetaceae bacterium]